MALVSLYDDLPHFEYDKTIDNLENLNTKLKTIIQELKQQIKKLEKENLCFKNVNTQLSKNITSLYKTAFSEIQRKDKIINDLRKSQVYTTPQTSKMFSSSNSLLLRETRNNEVSEKKQDAQQINNTVDKSKVLSQNSDNFINKVIQPNHDIPKTVYYKRLCQKLVKQNEMIELKTKMLKCRENNNIFSTDKVSQNKNELVNDENILKEVATTSVEISNQNPNSTLVICESDVILSDCELNSTSVSQHVKMEKDKENVSLEPYFSKLKEPKKLKKKMIITPATIGVQHMPNKTMKYPDKLNRRNVAIKEQYKISRITQEHKFNKVLNVDTESVSAKKLDRYDSKMEDKQVLTRDIIPNQEPSISENNNQITFINTKVEQVPIKRRTVVEKKCSNNLAPTKVKKSTCVTRLSASNDDALNVSTKSVKCLSMINEKESPNLNLQKINLLDSKASTIYHNNNLTECVHSNNSAKCSSKNTLDKTSYIDKPGVPSINIEVEQVPIKRRTVVEKIGSNNLAPIKVKKSSRVTRLSASNDDALNVSIKSVKCLSMINEKKSVSSVTQKNSQVDSKSPVISHDNNLTECVPSNNYTISSSKNTLDKINYIDKPGIPSINIEVEQFPIKRRTVAVVKRDSNVLVPIKVKKSSYVTCLSPSVDGAFNVSTESIQCKSMINEKKLTSSITPNNNQSDSKSPIINLINNSPQSVHSNDTEIYSKNVAYETSDIYTSGLPSIYNEVEQGTIFRRSNIRSLIMHSTPADNKLENKKGRRVQLITIKDHYSQPVPSFNGAKKTEIDVSKKSIHIEKVVESSSLFYVPQVKRQRTMNFGNADS